MTNLPFERIEDLFEPVEPQPTSIDEVVDRLGFDETYAALLSLAADNEEEQS